MSKDPAIGKRSNPTANTGLSTDKENALFDVTQWRKEQQYRSDQLILLTDMLRELKILNIQIQNITGERIADEDIGR
jgi:hypothetical protein